MPKTNESLHEPSAAEPRRPSDRCRQVANRGRQPIDSRLTREINARLKSHPDLDSRGIDVRVHRGVVVLLGMVSDAELRQLAEAIAGGIDGVQRIHNQLTARFDGLLFG